MTRTSGCIIVGGGHAGASAAISAVEAGCKDVLIVEKAPEKWVGGNGYFTAGDHRTVHTGHPDHPIVTNVTAEQAEKIDLAPYTADEFIGDTMRLGENAELVKTMVENSRDAVRWLAETVKIPFILAFHRQAYEVNGKQKFWGGLALSVEDGGKGLTGADLGALQRRKVEMWFDTPAVRLVTEDSAVTGVVVQKSGEEVLLKAPAVILVCGGYESSQELRIKYLGPEHVETCTGDRILMTQTIGAKLVGDWRGCHSTCWDTNAPTNAGDRKLSNKLIKSWYSLGIMVNINGEWFVDEGQDFRNDTYVKIGKQILLQPEGYALQVWDAKTIPRLRREEYGDGVVQKIIASTVEELAGDLMDEGLQDKESFLRTVREYNDAVHQHRMKHPGSKWDPAVEDGLSTRSSRKSLTASKSNWTLPIEKGPFLTVKVACGTTFTFGGLAIDPGTGGVPSESILHWRDDLESLL